MFSKIRASQEAQAKEETMTRVKTFNENAATGRLAEVYGEVMKHPLAAG
jgi:hypothetical protein